MARERGTSQARRGGRSAGAGFSLVELMIALGILAIALPMIGTAFLSGMVENKESVDNTMGMLLAGNALSVLRVRVTHSDLLRQPGPWNPNAPPAGKKMAQPEMIPVGLLGGTVGGPPPADLNWKPYDRELPGESSRFACVVFAQRLTDYQNDYRIVVMPYRKFAEGDVLADGANAPKVTFKTSPPAPVGEDDTIDTTIANTHVFLNSGGVVNNTQSAHIGAYVVRMGLKP